jgi:hypothetical protein
VLSDKISRRPTKIETLQFCVVRHEFGRPIKFCRATQNCHVGQKNVFLTYITLKGYIRGIYTNNGNPVARRFFCRLVSRDIVRHCATSCNIVRHRATLRNIVRHCATLYNIVQHRATSCNIAQHRATSCNIVRHRATLCDIARHRVTLRDIARHRATGF